MPEILVIKSSQLTNECWFVQFRGLSYCQTCESKDTNECGGQRIRETGQNSKGVKVPIGRRIK